MYMQLPHTVDISVVYAHEFNLYFCINFSWCVTHSAVIFWQLTFMKSWLWYHQNPFSGRYNLYELSQHIQSKGLSQGLFFRCVCFFLAKWNANSFLFAILSCYSVYRKKAFDPITETIMQSTFKYYIWVVSSGLQLQNQFFNQHLFSPYKLHFKLRSLLGDRVRKFFISWRKLGFCFINITISTIWNHAY